MNRYNCYTMEIRFKFDKEKSRLLRKERGASFEEVQDVFFRPYYIDFRNDDPEQFRAIGLFKERLYSVIFEMRTDNLGDYYHLVTLWKSTKEEKALYEKYT